MLKFLYFGDMHGGTKAPKHRIDNFQHTRQAKIKEILHLAKQHNVTALLQAGDFLNKPHIAPEFLTQEIIQWSEHNLHDIVFEIMTGAKTMTDLEVAIKDMRPMIGIIGNHELIGGELDSFDKTSLNTLVQMGFMTLTQSDNPVVFTDESGFKVAITGSHYTHDIDKADGSAYIVKEKQADFHIHMAHGMLMDKSYGKKFAHTVIQEIAYDTQADLTINGHDHIGYQPIEMDGKLFANPGSPVRLSAEKKEIERMPHVMLITVDETTGVSVEYIPLTCAEQGADILSRDHLKQKEAKAAQLEEMKSLMNQAGLKQGVNITEIVANLGKTKLISESLIQEVIEDITESMQALDTPFNPAGAYTIERLELENFQSHKKSVFDFEDGLNILAGESRSGKSAVLRAIRELFECYMRNPRDAIFFGADALRITATLSNGYVITRIVERKKTGKNGYEIYDPKTGEVSYYNTKGVGLVQEIFGLNKIKLSERNKVNVNFLTQGESWFMLGNNMTAPDRAKLIGVMYGTHYADAVLKTLNGQSRQIISNMNTETKEIEQLDSQLAEYQYVEALESLLLEASAMQEEIETLTSTIAIIESYTATTTAIQAEQTKLNEIIEQLESTLPTANQLLTAITSDATQVERGVHTWQTMQRIVEDGRMVTALAQSLKTLPQATLLYQSLLTETELFCEFEKDVALLHKGLQELQAIQQDGLLVRTVRGQLASLPQAITLFKSCFQLTEDISFAEQQLNQAHRLIRELEQTQNQQSTLCTIETALNPLSQARETVEALEKEEQTLNQATIATCALISAQGDMQYYQPLTELDSTLAPISDSIQALEAEYRAIEKAERLQQELLTLESSLVAQQRVEDELNEKQMQSIEQYKTALSTLTECPTCHGAITDDVTASLLARFGHTHTH